MTSMTRRTMMKITGVAAFGACLAPRIAFTAPGEDGSFGYVIGNKDGELAGMKVLAEGGNAVDAIVAAALVAAVADPLNTGIGGYGMSAIVATSGGKQIAAIDGNSTAPSAMRADTFKSSTKINELGWMSAGVPGLMAGLALTLEKFGTRSFADTVGPAIQIARNGFPWKSSYAAFVKNTKTFRDDNGSRKLYMPGGNPLPAGTMFKNPDLAALLESLAKANSVESFYRGDIAQQIADGFQKNGGLVTAKDMADYKARIVEPLAIPFGDAVIHTAPLTAGGITILQILNCMQAMNWKEMPAGIPQLHAKIEAARIAWRDRLTLFGDPDFVKVPVEKMLSAAYAGECAEKIQAAVKAGAMLEHPVKANMQHGTVNLSAADTKGNFVALTLTHGGAFGSCVTVDGLGLTLGHGVSRFDPHPEHPNAPGPGKRPLHNMCPTMVTKGGKPVMAIGGAGGRKIPNAILEVLTEWLIRGKPVTESIAAPRFHTEGDKALTFEKSWPAAETGAMRKIGYAVRPDSSAFIGAVTLESGRLNKAWR